MWCEHMNDIDLTKKPVTPEGCQECLATGDTWVHLRYCRTCGHIGCCDQSKNKHAAAHYAATEHPIMQSFERGEKWGWCYVDNMMISPRFFTPNKVSVDVFTPLAITTFILLASIAWISGLPLWAGITIGLIGAVLTRAIAEWRMQS